MAVFEVPLSPQAQKFSIALGVTSYNMTVTYNAAPQGGWVLDIADSNDAPILNGVPLVTGANLLAQYAYLNFGGSLIVQTDYDLNAVPTFKNLGVHGHLFFITPDA